MSSAAEATARADDGSITVHAGPGGGIRSVELTGAALDRGASWLAGEILRTAATATAHARVRTRAALRVAGVDERTLDGVGLPEHKELAQQLESTTPTTWRTQ
jgi:hypothetical protein